MKTNAESLHKYDRKIGTVLDHEGKNINIFIDVYDVLKAFEVRCPAIAHAIKKLLAPGKRGVKSKEVDLREAQICLERAIQLNLDNDGEDNA